MDIDLNGVKVRLRRGDGPRLRSDKVRLNHGVGARIMGIKKKMGVFVVPSVLGLLLGFILICWDLDFSRWGRFYLKNIRNIRYSFLAPDHINLGY